jgi:ATP-dependent Lon protease
VKEASVVRIRGESGNAATSGRGEPGRARPIPEDALLILPARGVVLFPGSVLPLTVGRKRSLAAVQEAMRAELPIGLVLQHDPETEEPAPEEIHRVGTVAAVLRFLTAPDGGHHVICQGLQRFRVIEWLAGRPYYLARVELITEPEPEGKEVDALALRVKQQVAEMFKLMPTGTPDFSAAVQSVAAPTVLSDLVASYVDFKPAEKQDLLETLDPTARLAKLTHLLAERLEILQLSHTIDEETKDSMKQAQREYFLRQQLKTIQRELGEEEGRPAELEELGHAIEAAHMSEEAEKQARKELSRLERMPEASAEYSMVRTYLDWLIELPWSQQSDDSLDLGWARTVLDEDHHDLDRVKRRIVEFLAVRKLKPSGKSPILLFVGPPGVGKTSLGQSIARAMGRKFVRISVGGVHDESEIRGHRRTYVGALPGIILQQLRKAGTRNPVFMIDEIDKMGAGIHGDPASALLEVLDPEQNHTFRDNYLAVPFNLSRVLFIGTANVLEEIRGPLRDRFEVIEIPGYTEEDKLEIARRYLVRRQLEESGLSAEQCQIEDDALRAIVRHYTREAGCRQLEREIAAAFRQVAVRVADGEAVQVRIGPDDLGRLLGPRKFEGEVAMRVSLPGVATGLAWTPTGGDILFVEATRMEGDGKLILTGQLGDVMKESARAALSLVRSRARELGLPSGFFERTDVHVHVPAGAVPKDGPSAGVAMYVALVSLFTGRTVRSDAAMTGEISLRGLVLPVGGVKSKVLAAARAGIDTILLPARNRVDMDEVPEAVRQKLKFVLLENVDEAVHASLETPGPLEVAPPVEQPTPVM